MQELKQNLLILALLIGVVSATDAPVTMKLVGKLEVYTQEYKALNTQAIPDSIEYKTSLGERVVFIPKNEAVDSILTRGRP
jgi:hypothetical protein